MKRKLAIAVWLALAPGAASACLWDYDTLKTERARFPDALELITGRFPRHSKAFYEWRAADRRARLEKTPDDPALYDDLSVALEKLGRGEEAIEVARQAEAKWPDRYEVQANLGTFLLHAGRFEEGLRHIDRALQINPDAHFGREVYQKALVEYLIAKGGPKPSLPLATADEMGRLSGDFAKFLAARLPGAPAKLPAAARKRALKGVLGMMRFGNHDSPILLEAAAHLLSDDPFQHKEDAKQLAARAYLRAAQARPESAEAYRALAAAVMKTQTARREQPMPLARIEEALAAELVVAEREAAAVVADEARWIAEGVDVDAAFARKYLRKR